MRTLATRVLQASIVRRPSPNTKKLVMAPSGAKASPSTRSTRLSWSTTSNDMPPVYGSPPVEWKGSNLCTRDHGPVDFLCPRCGTNVDDELYGPCLRCRGELRAAYAGEARTDVDASEYEPKMNVTPNAVASKE